MTFRRVVASIVSAALIWTAPGFAAYAAAGEMAARPAPAFRASAAPLALPSVNVAIPNAGSLGVKTISTGVSLPEVSIPGAAAQAGRAASQVSAVAPGALAPQAVVPGAQNAAQRAVQPQGLMQHVGSAQDPLAPAIETIASQSLGESRGTGYRIIDRIVGWTSRASASDASVSGAEGAGASNLAPSGRRSGPPSSPTPPSPKGPSGSNKRSPWIVRALGVAARVVAGAAVVVGLQIAAVAAAPALFGVAPVAAVWAVSSGILILPAALYTRHLLSKRDSPALKKTKWALDVFIGAFIGAAIIAAPAFSITLAAQAAAIGIPLTLASSLGTVFAAQSGGRGLDILLTAGTLASLPVLFGVAGTGVIGIGAILGMAALPAMTTIAFFLGRIVTSAETGQPFTIPGSMQKIRFPAFNWVMIGVVFALLSGYGAVHSNLAFFAWTFFGNATGSKWDKSKPLWRNVLGKVLNFNVMWLGLLVFTAATGFTSPLTFLVLAFSAERAAHWTERLLGRFYRKADAAPSTTAKPADDRTFMERLEDRNPELSHWLKTGLLIATMLGVAFTMGTFVFGFASLLKNAGVAALLVAIPFIFSNKLVKAMMKGEPTDEVRDPEFFGIMTELREKINKDRAASGKKAIPMPEMINVPMDVPNAFATGRSPFKATVGVTVGIKRMLLEPRNVRRQLTLLIKSHPEGSDAFKVFRRGIAGSITGVDEGSTADQISQALERAPDDEVRALGVRMLRGVLGHEFMHVMDRHMLTGSVTGLISSAVAFASYGVMWGVGHAKAAAAALKARVTGKGAQAPSQPKDRATDLGGPAGEDGVKPEALDPISTGIVLKSLPALLRMLAALWGPVVLQILQMTASRNNESQADTDGAKLTEDPESLALALGMLMTWRPPEGFRLNLRDFPRLAGMQQIFTVNPIQQLEAAGQLKDGNVLGKRENWLFNLFITHPDTNLRIENLYRHSERMRRQPPAGPPSDDGGGGPAPPLAFNSFGPESAPTKSRGAVFLEKASALSRRAWVKATSLVRVLPDEERNAEYWKFVLGQALISMGAYFHYTALPKLAAPTKADAQQLSWNRGVNWGAQLASNLVSGPIVDRGSMRSLLVWTHLGRALLMLAVPVLFFHGYLLFPVFLLVIFGAGFLQNTSITAGSVAFQRIIGPHTAYYNRANAVFNLVVNVTGIVAPLLAGAFIGAMDARYGLLAGNALAYAVYGALLLAVAVGYGLFLRVPKALKAAAAPAPAPEPAAKKKRFAELSEGFSVLWKNRFLRLYLLFGALSLMAGDALIFTALPRYIEDVLGSQSAAGGALASVPILGAAVSGLVSKSGAFGLYLAASSTGMLVSSVAMALARDKAGAALAAVGARARERLETARVPEDKIDAAVEALVSAPAAVLARYAEAWREDASLARGPADLARDAFEEAAKAAPSERLELAGARAELEAWAAAHWPGLEKRARRTARSGLDDLERQGRWSSYLHGLGWLAYLGVFLYTGLWGSVASMALALLLHGPAVVIWSSLVQRVISQAAPQSMGKVYSAMFFFQLAMSIVGVFVFGGLLASYPTAVVLMLVAAVAVVCAALDFIVPFVVFPLSRKGRGGPNPR